MTFDDALNEMPIIAILRCVTPEEAVAAGDALYSAGVRIVEVPLNSPEPFDSIKSLADAFHGRMVVGGGTVLSADAARKVAQAGGRIIVSPNTDIEVIRTTVSLGLTAMPGFVTPSEAFRAVGAGAMSLKLFPAASFGAGHVKAVKDVLPAEVKIYPVGGVKPADFAEWRDAGADGFGLGGEIYKAGRKPAEIAERAKVAIDAWKALSAPVMAKVA